MPRYLRFFFCFGIAVGCYGVAANIVMFLAARGSMRVFFSLDPRLLLDSSATLLFFACPFLLLIGSWLCLRSDNRGVILLIVYGFALVLANLTQGIVRFGEAGNFMTTLDIRDQIFFCIGELDNFIARSLFPGFLLLWLLIDRRRLEKPAFEVTQVATEKP